MDNKDKKKNYKLYLFIFIIIMNSTLAFAKCENLLILYTEGQRWGNADLDIIEIASSPDPNSLIQVIHNQYPEIATSGYYQGRDNATYHYDPNKYPVAGKFVWRFGVDNDQNQARKAGSVSYYINGEGLLYCRIRYSRTNHLGDNVPIQVHINDVLQVSFQPIDQGGSGDKVWNNFAYSEWIEINIPICEEPSEAVDDSVTTSEDTPIIIDVLANDSAPDADSLSIDFVSQPKNGGVTINDSKVIYTPGSNFNGTDTFSYTVSDNKGVTDTATVTIIVDAVNDNPEAIADSVNSSEDTPVTIDVLANDSDPDGDSFLIDSVSQAENGDVTINGSKVIYTPDSNFNGTDTFSYTVSDNKGVTDTATVTIIVDGVNDNPEATADSVYSSEDTPVTIDVLANDSDPDGDPLSINSISQPVNGAVAINDSKLIYTPDLNFHGTDTFIYTVSDNKGGTDAATVTTIVGSINDSPEAVDDSVSTSEDTSVTIDVLTNDSDPDGDPLLIDSVSQAENGDVTINDSNVIYTPDSNFNGTDTVIYTVSDNKGGTDTATVIIIVDDINDNPEAVDDSVNTLEDTTICIDVLANDSDPDGDPLLVDSVSQPDNGTVTINDSKVIYTPNSNFNNTDTFTYTVSDNKGGTAIATVTVIIHPVKRNCFCDINGNELIDLAEIIYWLQMLSGSRFDNFFKGRVGGKP